MSYRTTIITLFTASLVAVGCTKTESTTPDSGDQEQTTTGQEQTTMNTSSSNAATPMLTAAQCGEIRNVHEFGGIYLTGQPSEADLAAAKAMGITTIVNQRHTVENTGFSEEEVATGLGLQYMSLAWNGVDELTDEMLDKTRAVFRDTPKPMLIHCGSANRTGATWLAYAVLDRGLSWEAALAEAETVGLRSEQYQQKVRDYIERKEATDE